MNKTQVEIVIFSYDPQWPPCGVTGSSLGIPADLSFLYQIMILDAEMSSGFEQNGSHIHAESVPVFI